MQRNNLHTQFLPAAAVAFFAAIAILRAITTAATFFVGYRPSRHHVLPNQRVSHDAKWGAICNRGYLAAIVRCVRMELLHTHTNMRVCRESMALSTPFKGPAQQINHRQKQRSTSDATQRMPRHTTPQSLLVCPAVKPPADNQESAWAT